MHRLFVDPDRDVLDAVFLEVLLDRERAGALPASFADAATGTTSPSGSSGVVRTVIRIDEIEKTAEDLKLIIDPDLAFIAEIDGKPMGMCILLPNVNEILHELRGSHWIVTMLKLVWRLKVQKRPPRSARCCSESTIRDGWESSHIGNSVYYMGKIISPVGVYIAPHQKY